MRTPERIRVPFMLHTLHASHGRTGSPSQPAVNLIREDLDGSWLAGDTLTPDQARALAVQLLAAANAAEGTR